MATNYQMHSIVNRFDQYHHLAEKREEWSRFSDQCATASPFCHPGVWLGWLETFREFDPVVYELRDGSELKALLPLYRDGATLHMAGGDHIDYQDIAAVSDAAAAALVFAVVEEAGREGSTLTFGKVAEHSRLRKALEDGKLSGVASIKSRYWSLCPTSTFDLRGPGRFLESLSSRQRKDYKSASKKISEAYPEHVIEHRFGKEIDHEYLAVAATLHQANQYRKKGKSVFADRDFMVFLERQASSGAPMFLSMMRDARGGPAMAFIMGYFGNDTCYYYITSYDGRIAALSPGRCLLVEVLKYCADRVEGGTLTLDLLSGEDGYKSRWATSFYEVARFQVIPKRISNLPRMAAYSVVYGLKSAKNRVLKWRAGGETLGGLKHDPPALTS